MSKKHALGRELTLQAVQPQLFSVEQHFPPQEEQEQSIIVVVGMKFDDERSEEVLFVSFCSMVCV